MKTRKNSRSFAQQMTRWYGRHWLRDSILLLACLVIIPVVVGSLV